MSRAGRSPLGALLAVLVVQACDNDTCPLAFEGHGCDGSTGCEQCLGESIERVLASDAEGREHIAQRAAADVAARLGVELEPESGACLCFDCGQPGAPGELDRCPACEQLAEGRYQAWLDDAAGSDPARRAMVQDLAATGELWTPARAQ